MLDKQTPLTCTPSPIIYAPSLETITKNPQMPPTQHLVLPRNKKLSQHVMTVVTLLLGLLLSYVREAYPRDARTLELTAAVHSGQDMEPPGVFSKHMTKENVTCSYTCAHRAHLALKKSKIMSFTGRQKWKQNRQVSER